jgi:hypothetical protein
MIPDPKWLDALRLPLKATVGVALASVVLLSLDLTGLLDLGPLGPYTRPILIILSVVFSILVVTELIDGLSAPLREKRRQSALVERRAVRRREEEQRLAVVDAKQLLVLIIFQTKKFATLPPVCATDRRRSTLTSTAQLSRS